MRPPCTSASLDLSRTRNASSHLDQHPRSLNSPARQMAATFPPITRFRSISPQPSSSRSSLSASVSPPPQSRISPRRSPAARRSSEKENVEPRSASMEGHSVLGSPLSRKANGRLPTSGERDIGNGGGRTWRDGSVESSDNEHGVTNRRSNRHTKSPTYDGLPTLSTISDPDEPSSSTAPRKPPPPAPSTASAKADMPGRPGTRKRRSSSIKRKPSPGVTPTKAVDWEIPRKTLHSSIG